MEGEGREIPPDVQKGTAGSTENPRWLTRDPWLRQVSEGLTTEQVSLSVLLNSLACCQGFNEDGTITGDFTPVEDAPSGVSPWHVIRTGSLSPDQWTKIIVGDRESANGYYINTTGGVVNDNIKVVHLVDGNPTDEVVLGAEINRLADNLYYDLQQTGGNLVYRPAEGQ